MNDPHLLVREVLLVLVAVLFGVSGGYLIATAIIRWR